MRNSVRGFSLAELLVTVAVAGVLATLATHGVRGYVRASRAAEARNNVGQMAKDAATAYARESLAGAVLNAKATAASKNRLCTSATRTVPQNAAQIRGKKYQSSPAEWAYDAKTPGKGFACLKFSMTSPQHFLYRYRTSTTAVASAGDQNVTFDAIAQGDLDGDGKLSEFKISGKIVKAGKGLELLVAPSFAEKDPDE